MSKKQWVDVDFEDCPECGNELECLTDGDAVNGRQSFYDGDEVRCLGECGAILQISVDDGRAWVSWHEPECETQTKGD